MLGLMAWIFAIRGDVPNNRPEIYRECATLMFERWDQNRGIIVAIPTDFELIDLFAYLASEIFGRPDLEEGVHRDWLHGRIKRYFLEWYEDRSKAAGASNALIEFVVGRAWILSEVGQDLFKFTHRTFLEYFYARHINSQYDTPYQLVSSLKRYIQNGQRDVICHLSLQIFNYRETRRNRLIIKELINPSNLPPRNLGRSANWLVFVASALQYLVSSESQFREVATFVVDQAIAISLTGETYALAAVRRLIRNCRARDAIVADALTKRLSIGRDDASVRDIFLALLKSPYLRHVGKMVLADDDFDSYKGELKELFARKLAELLESEFSSSVEAARRLIELRPDRFVWSCKKFGEEFIEYGIYNKYISIRASAYSMCVAIDSWTTDDRVSKQNIKEIGEYLLSRLGGGISSAAKETGKRHRDLTAQEMVDLVVYFSSRIIERRSVEADSICLLCLAAWWSRVGNSPLPTLATRSSKRQSPTLGQYMNVLPRLRKVPQNRFFKGFLSWHDLREKSIAA